MRTLYGLLAIVVLALSGTAISLVDAPATPVAGQTGTQVAASPASPAASLRSDSATQAGGSPFDGARAGSRILETPAEATPQATATPAPAPSPTATPTPMPASAVVPPSTAQAPMPATALMQAAVNDGRPADQYVDVPDVAAHYRLDITDLNLGSGAVHVVQRVEIQSRQGALSNLYFTIAAGYYGFFTLEQTTVNGNAVAVQQLNEGYTLAVPLPGVENATVEFRFRLNLRQVGGDFLGVGRDGNVIRLGNWFPIISNDHRYPSTADPSYTRSARFDVWLPLPGNIPFASTGQEAGRETLGDGRVRYHLRADNVRDFALVISPDFQVTSRTSGTGVLVEFYAPPSVGPGTRAATLDAAAYAIDRLSTLLGPYPYPVFRVVDPGTSFPSGLEFPMLIYINPRVSYLTTLVYHETAHQWLFALIGTRPQQDPWIDEGGAQFLETGLAYGFQGLSRFPGGYGTPLDASDYELPSGTGIPGYNEIYLQGQQFYASVLGTMGADNFWNAMQHLYARYRYDVVTPWDVLLNWQRHSTVDLRPLFKSAFRYGWIDQLPGPQAERYFPETGKSMSANFRRYWDQFGGLATFGYPITEPYLNSAGILTQYFERARFELHPGLWSDRHDVLLGRLGVELAAGRESEAPFRPLQVGSDANCTFYPETGHRLCFGFRTLWEQRGGLATFGFPISEEFRENGVVVQYFERQRFEYHPENQPPYDLLGGLLGSQAWERFGPR